MTKETKIGLLVGLAFIILFAIILSEKGAPQRDAKSPNFATLPNRPDGSAITAPLQDGGRVPVENHLNPIVQPTEVASSGVLTEEPIISASAMDEDSLPQLPESVMKIFADTSDASSATPVTRSTDAAVDAVAMNTTPSAVPSHSVTPGPAASPPRGVFVPQGDTVATGPRVGGPVAPPETVVSDRGLIATRTEPVAPPVDRSATMIPAAATNDTPTVIRTTHTVKDGDCVSKIAAEYYGRSTPDRIKLIETANRDVLKQKKGIRAGDKIKIPELAGYEDRFEPVAGFTQPRNSKPATPDPRSLDATIISDRTAVASAAGGESDRVEPFEIKDGMPRVPKAVPEAGKPSNGAIALVPPPVDEHANASADRLVKVDSSPRLSKTRWYEVRSGDTLSGIARRELGNERQFKTIYKLNKDILTDKHTLKPGTKLRLPPAEDPSLSSSVTTGRTSPGTEP